MKKIILAILFSQALSIIGYGQVDLSKNLVLHFPFSNNLTDASGLGATASKFNGGPSFGYDRESQANSALSFNGSGALKINASNNVLDFGTAINMTMSFWFKTSSDFYTKFYIDNGNYQGISITLNEYTKGELLYTVRGSNASDRVELGYTDTKLYNNQWHHVAYTLNQAGKTLNLYVDGTLKKSIGYSGKTPDASPPDKTKIYIGSDFTGGYDELRFYSRILTLDEIKTLAGIQVSVEPLIANDKFFIQNPASGMLNIIANTPNLITEIKIVELSGKEVLILTIKNSTENTSTSISHLKAGLYYIEVKDIYNRLVKEKLVILN